MSKKIMVCGVESTGKTTLVRELSSLIGALPVFEFSREYLARTGGKYEEEDIAEILKGQLSKEEVMRSSYPQEWLVCDTGALECYVWSIVKYGKVAPSIEEKLRHWDYAVTLLPCPDLPWESDPLRESPDPEVRERLHEIYKKTLRSFGIPYAEISGFGVKRLQNARVILKECGI